MADGSLIFDTKVDESGFREGLEKLKNVGGKAFLAIGKAAIAVGTAISGVGIAAVKLGMDFEAQMSRVQAIAGATGQELEELKNVALKLGAETAFSASEVAVAMENLASAGFEINEIIAALPGNLDLAASSGADLATATDIAASILRGFQLEAKEAGRVADVLAEAANRTNAGIYDMGEAMKYVAPVAQAMGISMEETAAAIGILANAGIKGSQAGTTLRGALTRLTKPTKQMQEVMNKLGLEFFDAQGNIKSLAEIIKELEEGTKGLTQEQRNQAIATLFGQEALSGMLVLIEQGSDELSDLTKAFEDSSGAARAAAEIMMNNLKGAIEELQGALETLGILVYDSLNEPLKTAAQEGTAAVERLIEAFKERGFEGLIEELGSVLADVATQAAEFAPTLLEVGANMIMSFISGIQENLSNITKAALSIAQTLITSILEMLPQLVQLGAELLVALITGIAEMLPSLMTQIIDIIIMVADTIIQNLPLIIDAGIQLIMALVEGIINNLPTIIQAGIQTVLSIIDGISQSLPQLLEAAIEIITKLAEGLIENLDLLLDGAIKIVEALIEFIVQNLPLLTEAALEIITALIDYLIDNLPMLVDSAVELIMAIVEGLINNVELLVDAALQLVEGIVQGLLNNLPLLVEAAINLVYAIIDGLLQMIPELVATGIQLVLELIGAILSMIPQIISTGMQLVGELVIGILRAAPRLLTAGVTLVKTVIEGIKSAFSGIVEAGKDLVRGLWDGIISLKDWILGKVEDFAESIIVGIKKVFGISSPSAIMRDEIGENLTLGISVGFEKGIPELQRDVEKELGRLVERMKATVELEASTIGMKISAGSGVSKVTHNIINNDNGITQNININQPVESPSEVARHIKRVGRELALGY